MNADVAVLALLAWLAFLLSRTLQRRKVPELVGFVVAGLLVGPSGFGLLEDADLSRIRPVTEFALATLMFLVGERLSFRALRASRWVIASGAISYVLSGAAIAGAALALGANGVTVLVLAVLGGAGAPMTMASVTASAKARGSIPSGLIGSHAVSDAIAALAFAFAIPLAGIFQGSADVAEAVPQSLRLGLGAIVLGIVFGALVVRLSRGTEPRDVLVLALVHLLVAATVAGLAGVSLPLTALVMGATVASSRNIEVSQHIFAVLRGIEQPLYLVFFALAGASTHIDELAELGAVGVAYVVARSVGKVAGGTIGGLVGRLPFVTSLRIGGDLLPQAGVAVALAVLAADLLGDAGRSAAAVVLGSVVLFEFAGPVIAARSFPKLAVDDDGTGMAETLPDAVLLATTSDLDVPAWILDWCSRTSGGLTILGPGGGKDDGQDDGLDLLRRRCSDEGIPLHWRPLTSGVDFATNTVDVAAEIRADLTVVVVPPIDRPDLWLYSGAIDRIPSRVGAPVVLLPGRAGSSDEPHVSEAPTIG